jgi:hypothetical protein
VGRVRPTQSVWRLVLCLGQIQDPDGVMALGSLFDVILSGFLVILFYQDHYVGHYIMKRATHVMMLWKYKPLNQDDALCF